MTLAQADGNALFSDSLFKGSVVQKMNVVEDPQRILDSLSTVPLLAAAILVTIGILCIFNGYRWHKWVVAIMAFIIGIGMGHAMSQEMGKPMVVAAAVGLLCAIVATPLLKVTVALFGGITGAFIGINCWTALNEANPEANWAGGIIGFIIVAMASLVFFKLVVVLFTSVGGATMAILGGITLLLHVEAWESSVRDSLTSTPMLLPLLLALAAVGGFVIQESRLRAGGVKILSAADSKPA